MRNGTVAPSDKLAPKQAAQLIGVSVTTLCMWRQRQIGPLWHQRETKRIYYLRGDIDAWESTHAIGSRRQAD